MAIKRELVQFVIVNSTDCSFNIPLFQQNVYSINATTKYSWDITSEDISCGTGSLVINGVTYTFTYTGSSLVSLLASLNALGFGFFCSEVISGNTYIYTTDDTNVYGDLTLCSVTTTTTTTTTTAAPTTTTTTTSTTTEAPTTTTTTSTTTEAPTTTTTTSTTTEAPTTTTTTSTTTEAPTTTTTTSTTTEAPTTTTTTSTTTVAPITCTQWQNLSGISAYYDWTDCNGTVHLNEEILNNGIICAQDGTVSFISGGTLTSGSDCTPTIFNLAYSTVDGATACSTYPTTSVYYALTGSSFGNLTTIYTDFALTTLAPNGYYSDGVNYCDISGGTGTLQNQTSC